MYRVKIPSHPTDRAKLKKLREQREVAEASRLYGMPLPMSWIAVSRKSSLVWRPRYKYATLRNEPFGK